MLAVDGVGAEAEAFECDLDAGGGAGQFLEEDLDAAAAGLDSRPTTFRVPANGTLAESTIDAMSPVCRGLPRYGVNGAVAVRPDPSATTFPDPILLFAGMSLASSR